MTKRRPRKRYGKDIHASRLPRKTKDNHQAKRLAALNYEMTPTELANDRAMTEHVRARMGKDLDKGTVTDGVRCRVYVNGNRVP